MLRVHIFDGGEAKSLFNASSLSAIDSLWSIPCILWSILGAYPAYSKYVHDHANWHSKVTKEVERENLTIQAVAGTTDALLLVSTGSVQTSFPH